MQQLAFGYFEGCGADALFLAFGIEVFFFLQGVFFIDVCEVLVVADILIVSLGSAMAACGGH